MARNLKPVSIAGIEGDALISEILVILLTFPSILLRMGTMYLTQLY